MTNRKSSIAQAGRRGRDVRSDCWVGMTLADSGGIDLHLKSRVEAMYGDAIRRLVADMMAAFKIEHAKVEIEDAGALPFVLMARIEAAARRLAGNGGTGIRRADNGGTGVRLAGNGGTGILPVKEYIPDLAAGTRYETQRDRFRRSRLYLPGNEPKFMLNAGLHGPDGVILDLEDSVAPGAKDEARLLVRNALRSIDFRGAERMVRINQGERGLEDLAFVVPHNVHVVLIPKVESPEQVRRVDERIAEMRAARPPSAIPCRRSPIFLMPIIESALGAIRAYEIATASPNIVALTIGLEDYTADIGTQRTVEGRESFWARSQVLNAARAAGVQPIDSVFSDVADMEGLRSGVLEAKALGFEGKGCIHPRQIAVLHAAFAPTAAELKQARRIVEAFEDAQARGLAAVSLGSKMIDPPVVKRAQRIVRQAADMGTGD